ncbi:MAG TPA: S1 family peptidase [Kofleriaceae bacterium]|jgi:hypothetical protein|nr:S1 family peptidase [Kofleriaceae bacterium]
MTTTETIFACFTIASLAGCATDLDAPPIDDDIIGGVPTTGFPEVGMLGVTNGELLCTGFMVSPTIVITAAHCIAGGTSYGFYTGPGTLETVSLPTEAVMDSLPNVTKHAVASVGVYPHASLGTTPYTHDVAYVQLAQPIAGVTPETIGGAPPGSSICQAVGYGWESLESPTGLLKKMALERVLIDDAINVDVIVDTGIADRGDSGGPLICNGATVGTFSWIDDYLSETATRRYARLDGAVGTWIDNLISTTQPPPPPVPYQVGDAFDYTRVTPSSQMVSTMLGGFGYAASTAPKAVAIDSAGLGFVSIKPGATQADADRTALEACFVIGGGKPCTSLASANTFAVSEAGLPTSFTFSLAQPTLAAIPYATSAARASAIAAYAAITGFKAIAIGLDGTIVQLATTDVVASQAEANRIALERCEMQTKLAPCTLFAEGNSVVFAPNWSPVIDYAREIVGTNLPGATMASYTAHVPAYLSGVTAGYQGSIYIAADGDGGDAWETTAALAQSTALGFCNQYVGAGFRCLPYATNNRITFGPADLAGYSDYAVHCKSMPRASCAAHASMGCAAGSYYTVQTGGVALETCP